MWESEISWDGSDLSARLVNRVEQAAGLGRRMCSGNGSDPTQGQTMNRKRLAAVASPTLTLILALIRVPAQAQAPKTAYPSMAPLEQYLMADRNAEIALARSAAPEAISGDAKILVLGRHGYETAVEGKNGFVCVVERGWMSPADAPESWNPKLRGPICFNPPAARSVAR